MATIRRRGTTWQAQVRRQGHTTLSRTFRLKADAEQWARQKEAEIDRGELPVDTRVLRAHTLGALLGRYAATIIPRKRSASASWASAEPEATHGSPPSSSWPLRPACGGASCSPCAGMTLTVKAAQCCCAEPRTVIPEGCHSQREP